MAFSCIHFMSAVGMHVFCYIPSFLLGKQVLYVQGVLLKMLASIDG